MKETKLEKGITLITLTIIIVVLLILAVVAINSIIKDNILGKTENATKEYNQLVKNEQVNSNEKDNILGKTENATKEYNQSVKNEQVNSNENETLESLVALYKAGKLKVGDYVKYNASKNADGSAKTYKPDGETKGSLTGYTYGDLQVITQEDLNWRVLGYDSSKDELLLISGAPTTNPISMEGAIGYNNYENVLNETCKALYSNTSIGAIARSITMEDINIHLVENVYTKEQYNGNSGEVGEYGYRNENISSHFSYNKDEKKLTSVDTEVTLDLTSDAYFFTASEVIKDATKLEILLGKNDNPCTYYYYVATRFIHVESDVAGWSGGQVIYHLVGEIGCKCYSDGKVIGGPNCLRPVVSIKSNVTTKDVPILETAPTENWNDILEFYP